MTYIVAYQHQYVRFYITEYVHLSFDVADHLLNIGFDRMV
jgi:hypothetical protein